MLAVARDCGLRFEPYWLDLPLERLDSLELEEKPVAVPMLIPYEVMHAVWEHSREQFHASFLPANAGEGCLQFWQRALQLPWGQRHAGLSGKAPAELERTIPILYHVDGAELHRNSEHYIWSSQSLFGSGDVWEFKFLMASIPHARMRLPSTKKAVFARLTKFIAWAQKPWQSGVAPALDLDGRELRRALPPGAQLAGGWTAAFAGLKNDGKARKEIHGFKRFYGSMYCCDSCLAVQRYKRAPVPLFYGDFGEDAAYVATAISHEDYMAAEAEVSPWANVDGWRLELNYWDLLHVLFWGNSRDANASCIVEFMEHGLLAGTKQEQMDWLSKDFARWCRRERISCSRAAFSLASLGRESQSQYPELASWYKGMTVKTMCFWLAEKARELDDGSLHSNFRATCMWAMAEFLHTVDGGGVWLDDADVLRARRAGRLYLQCYQWLAVQTEEQGQCLWASKPKMHYFDHAVRSLHIGVNPKFVQCDADETFMNTCKRIGSRCHGKSVTLRLLQRYSLGVCLRFAERRQRGRWSLQSSRPLE